MLISGNPSEALSTALQIENENNALVGSFDGKSAVGAKKKPSLMSAFEEEQEEPTNQLSFLEDEEPIKEIPTIEPTQNKSGAMNMDYTEEELDAILEEESKKALKNFTEPYTQSSEPMELFPTQEGEQEEDNDSMGWFPKPKDE
jgi:hypothetical protein